MKTCWQNYIDVAWVEGGAGRIDVFDLGRDKKLAGHALADAAKVDRAVLVARQLPCVALWNDVQTKNVAIRLGGDST